MCISFMGMGIEQKPTSLQYIESSDSLHEAFQLVIDFLENRPLLRAYNAKPGYLEDLYEEEVGEFGELWGELSSDRSDELRNAKREDIPSEMIEEWGDSGFVALSRIGLILQRALDDDEASVALALWATDAMFPNVDLGEVIEEISKGKNGDHLPPELFDERDGDFDDQGNITPLGEIRCEVIVKSIRHIRDQFPNGKLPRGWRIVDEGFRLIAGAGSTWRQIDYNRVNLRELKNRKISV